MRKDVPNHSTPVFRFQAEPENKDESCNIKLPKVNKVREDWVDLR
ncbi:MULTISPECIES: hypothetical protein [Nostocales]|uniref:Uncharacterized protein n=2 Tax=Nostocales TaxID=1161 RepID=A0ABW8WSV3_9CYAN|nr:hypothetical protein [Tolypothrix bouteillei]